MDKEKKTKVLMVRLTETEYARIQAYAGERGRTLSDLLRACTFGQEESMPKSFTGDVLD